MLSATVSSDIRWTFDDAVTRGYRLSEAEREYILSGETATYTAARLEERIQSKVDLIPDRLNALFLDIALLSSGGYLNGSETEATWEKLVNLPDHIDIGLQRELRREQLDIDRESDTASTGSSSDAFGLGYQLGGLIHLLQAMTDQEHAWLDILSGAFHEYLLSGSSTDDLVNRYEKVADLLQRRTELAPLVSDLPKKSNMGTVRHTRMKGRILYEATVWSLSPVQVPEADDSLPSVNVEIAPGQLPKFERANGSNESLTKVNALASKLDADIESGIDVTYRGMDVEDVLTAVWEADWPLSSARIAEIIGQSVATNLVTSIMKKLSADSEGERWTSEQVVEGSNDGWKLTKYGQILFRYYKIEEIPSDWLLGIIHGESQGLSADSDQSQTKQGTADFTIRIESNADLPWEDEN